jgi:hypothetical protein
LSLRSLPTHPRGQSLANLIDVLHKIRENRTGNDRVHYAPLASLLANGQVMCAKCLENVWMT